MRNDEYPTKVDALKSELATLEQEAGITTQMESAREPLSFPDLDSTPEEYFAETHDQVRSRTRDVYFQVADLGLRKRLMRADGAIDKLRARSFEDDVQHERGLIAAAEKRANDPPWIWAGIFGIGFVAVGNWMFGMVGAIGGAVLGIFHGQSFVARDRAAAGDQKRAAELTLKDIERTIAELELRPAFFNESERITGNRDDEFDTESAFSNVLRANRKGS